MAVLSDVSLHRKDTLGAQNGVVKPNLYSVKINWKIQILQCVMRISTGRYDGQNRVSAISAAVSSTMSVSEMPPTRQI